MLYLTSRAGGGGELFLSTGGTSTGESVCLYMSSSNFIECGVPEVFVNKEGPRMLSS